MVGSSFLAKLFLAMEHIRFGVGGNDAAKPDSHYKTKQTAVFSFPEKVLMQIFGLPSLSQYGLLKRIYLRI